MERGGLDTVVTAAVAATMVRPGRPNALFMPAGVDPVAEVRERNADRLADIRARIAHVEAQQHPDPYDRKLNCPLVIALLDAVIAGHHPHALDNDFDADEIEGLYETARVKYHERGQPRDALFEEMLVLVGSMREMKTRPPLDSEDEEEANGEIIDEDVPL